MLTPKFPLHHAPGTIRIPPDTVRTAPGTVSGPPDTVCTAPGSVRTATGTVCTRTPERWEQWERVLSQFKIFAATFG